MTDAGCVNRFAALAQQDQARVMIPDLIRLMRIAGYGGTPECRRLIAEPHGHAVMPGEQLRLYVVRARERLPGGRALWGIPNLRPANDCQRLRF